jgi:transposase
MMDLNWCFCGALPDTTVDDTSSQHNTDGVDDEIINSFNSKFTNTKIDTTLVIIPNEDVVVKKETGYIKFDTTMKKFMRRWRMSYRRNNNKRRRGHNNKRKSFFHRWSSSRKKIDHPIYTQEEFDKEFDKLLTLDISKAMSTVSESAKSTGEKTLVAASTAVSAAAGAAAAGAGAAGVAGSKDVSVKRSQSFLRKRSISWTKRRSRKVDDDYDLIDTRDDETINCMYSYDEEENVEVKSMLYNQRDKIERVNSITNKNKEVVEQDRLMCGLSNVLISFMEHGCDADDMACLSRNPYDTTLKLKNPDDTQSESSSGVSTITGEKISHRSKLGYEEIY